MSTFGFFESGRLLVDILNFSYKMDPERSDDVLSTNVSRLYLFMFVVYVIYVIQNLDCKLKLFLWTGSVHLFFRSTSSLHTPSRQNCKIIIVEKCIFIENSAIFVVYVYLVKLHFSVDDFWRFFGWASVSIISQKNHKYFYMWISCELKSLAVRFHFFLNVTIFHRY